MNHRLRTDYQSSMPVRGFGRIEAANYIGVSPTLFDQMVRDGRMPPPKRVNSRTIWDRLSLDVAFDGLPEGDECNPWDREPI